MKSIKKRLFAALLTPVVAIAFFTGFSLAKPVKADTQSKVYDKFTIGSWVSFY